MEGTSGGGTPADSSRREDGPTRTANSSNIRYREDTSLNISTMVEAKDILTLICTMRSRHADRRLGAALGLVQFAREAERGSHGGFQLRNEIRGSGGFHAFLTLFGARHSNDNQKLVASMAVAYILPSLINWSLEMRQKRTVVECMRFLVEWEPPQGETSTLVQTEMVSRDDVVAAATVGLCSFWVTHLGPDLDSVSSSTEAATTAPVSSRQRIAELRNLLIQSVSLAMTITQYGSSSQVFALVEHACAVKAARPLLVQRGILGLLLDWLRSGDPESIRAGAMALRHLMHIQDSYSAGWIHTELINQGGLRVLTRLSDRVSVHLPIAQILDSLCSAPHSRAAVVDADCTGVLLELLLHHEEPYAEATVFYSMKAVVKLASGCISSTSSSVNVNSGLQIDDFLSAEQAGEILMFILAVAPFVTIALNHQGRLRTVAVEALNVLSRDDSPSRQTRSSLCSAGAVEALSLALKDAVSQLEGNGPSQSRPYARGYEYLVQALRAVANILNPGTQARINGEPEPSLVKACVDATNHGGLDTILKVVQGQLSSDEMTHSSGYALQLLEESCAALSSMSPLILTRRVAEAGYSSSCIGILSAFHGVLRQFVGTPNSERGESNQLSPTETVRLQETVLRGLAGLAVSYPLQTRIMEKTLPYLIKAMSFQDSISVSSAAERVVRLLDVTDDEVAMQVAGLNPGLIVDWFCLQRSLILQWMARTELLHLLSSTWKSDCSDIFSNLSLGGNEQSRQLLLQQYLDAYGPSADGEANDMEQSYTNVAQEESLLAHQVYPLSSSSMERDFVREHRDYMNSCRDSISSHATKLLDTCFPSRLLREQIVPISRLRRSASFDFRALLMPQRQYLSLGREMKLLARICERETVGSRVSDVHWTLGFTNSTFAGDFSDSLVQLLYLCPTIRGLSFARDIGMGQASVSDGEESSEGYDILARLAGTLPPSISHLTFDGVLSDQDLVELVAVLKGVGGLAADLDPKSKSTTAGVEDVEGSTLFLAIKNSPWVSSRSWQGILSLFAPQRNVQALKYSAPLQSLESLDLSFNKLGDGICADILHFVFRGDVPCRLKELDLSGNKINCGTKVIQVLANCFGRGGRQSLQTLRLASNGVHENNAWLSILKYTGHESFSLQNLDLSANGICFPDEHIKSANAFIRIILRSRNLVNLNLSSNNFTPESLNYLFGALADASAEECVLGFLQFENNEHHVTEDQKDTLRRFLLKTREHLLSRKVLQEEQDADDTQELPGQTVGDHPDASIERRTDGDQGEGHLEGLPRSKNLITVLYSAPLVVLDTSYTPHPMEKLDFEYEREIIWHCLKEASRDVELSFDNATRERFGAAMAKKCTFLHYSGHGHKDYLPLEDPVGRTDWFKVDLIRSLIQQQEGGHSSFKCVFVSACYSGVAGRCFAEAGVPHVVCCRQDCDLKDSAALEFTRQFYMALLFGNSVREAFEQGRRATLVLRNLRNAETEVNKFELLGDGDHSEIIFEARPVLEWPRRLPNTTTARNSELVLGNLIQDVPSPAQPLCFLGREVPMQKVVEEVMNRQRRLVSVVGSKGIGRSSLVCAVCHFINERKNIFHKTIQKIYFVEVKERWRKRGLLLLFEQLLRQLIKEKRVGTVTDEHDIDSVHLAVCEGLRKLKALIVFDRVDLLDDSEEVDDFPTLLKDLCHKATYIKVLLTGSQSLGFHLPPLREYVVRLGPLTFENSVKLFARLCPQIKTRHQRTKLAHKLVSDDQEGKLCPGSDIADYTKRKFELLGNGIPAAIETAAHNTKVDELYRFVSENS